MAEYTPEELASYPISIGRRKPFYERFGIPRSEPYQPPDCGDTLEQLIEQDERHAADIAAADDSGDGASAN